jgi:hypothetical protein
LFDDIVGGNNGVFVVEWSTGERTENVLENELLALFGVMP